MIKFRVGIVLFALFFPLFLTWIYFVQGEGNPVFQKGAYFLGKLIQFSSPLIWTIGILKAPWILRRFSRKGVLSGALFGLVVGSIMIFLFHHFKDHPQFESQFSSLNTSLHSRFGSLGFTSPFPFLMLGLFYSVIHSGLEEYYWRWFTFREIKKLISWIPALLIASLGFTFHHILVLGAFFGYRSFFCWLSCFGVFCGGVFWCWLYRRSDSIWGCWIGHGLIDAAIFVIGYQILFQTTE
ncbi:MAG: CPBP family intramembrane metalloprotease [Planctomycetia bacterium]|nr:CPBP family intramembrane metalloprotease [Planctomycetia bacterium]